MKRREEKFTFLSQGKTIAGLIEKPAKPTNRAVIFAHGLSNSKAAADIPLLYAVNQKLLAAGYLTMRFDFYGSGESDGEFRDKTISAMHQNFLDALNFLKTTHPEISWVGAVGKSIGGTVLALVGGDQRVSAHVLITMRFTLAPFFANFWSGQEAVDLGGKVPPTGAVKGVFALQKDFFTELPIIDAGVALGLSKIKSSLVVMNEGDEKISAASAEEVYDQLGGAKQLLTIPGHDHELRGHETAIVAAVIKFFNQSSL